MRLLDGSMSKIHNSSMIFLGQDFDAKKAEGIEATFVDTKVAFILKTWVCYGSS